MYKRFETYEMKMREKMNQHFRTRDNSATEIDAREKEKHRKRQLKVKIKTFSTRDENKRVSVREHLQSCSKRDGHTGTEREWGRKETRIEKGT